MRLRESSPDFFGCRAYPFRLTVFLTFLSLFFPFAFSAPVLDLGKAQSRQSLAGFIDVLDGSDAKGLYPEPDISLLNRFTPLDITRPAALENFGHTLWVKFTLRNSTGSQTGRWLKVQGGSVEALQAYRWVDGHLIPLSVILTEKVATVPLSIAPLATPVIFIKMALTEKKAPRLILVKPLIYAVSEAQLNALIGLLFGGLAIIFILGLIVGVSYRERLFAFFSLQVLASICLLFIRLSETSIWPDLFPEEAIFFFIFLINFAGLMQARYYLGSWSLSEPYQNALKFAMVFNLVGMLLLSKLIGSDSLYAWVIYALFVPVQLTALLYCYRFRNDRYAFYWMITRLLCLTAVTVLLFYRYPIQPGDNAVDLFALLVMQVEYTLALFFLMKHFNHLSDDRHRELLFQAINLSKNQSQQALLNDFTHDLRTPVTGIMGIAEILKNGPATPDQKELIHSIVHSGQVLLNKINEVNSRLQLQQNNQMPQNTAFELSLLVDECGYDYRLQVAEKNIEFIIHIQSSIPDVVLGDANRIRQVLMQLIKNAVTYTAQGEVIVQLKSLDARHEDILFSVKDTGRGIGKQELQALRTEKPDQKDMSGLTQVRLHLKALSSELSIASKLGEGSEFSFVLKLPRSTQHLNEQADAAKQGELLQGKNLLIVDDNHSCCRVLKEQATGFGMHAFESHDGNEALALFRAKRNLDEPFHAIIIDFDMPHMSGVEVAERILAESRMPPVMIMLTGLNIAPTEQTLARVGIQAVLTKPVSKKVVQLTLIDQFIARQKAHGGIVPSHKKTTLHVLIAEDNDVSRRVISKMMTLLGFTYKMVSDGHLATDAVKKETFDIILMDCEMPVMNGFDATLEIHRWQRYQGREITPVIALSAHIMEEHKIRSRNVGMASFLEKPIKLNQLKALLNESQLA